MITIRLSFHKYMKYIKTIKMFDFSINSKVLCLQMIFLLFTYDMLYYFRN
jgi:hypothetical protein